MANFYSAWVTPPNGGARFRLNLAVNVASQSIVNNTSTLSWSLIVEKDRSQAGYYSWTSTKTVTIDGSVRHGPVSNNLPNAPWPGTSTATLATGSYTVDHEADGTKTAMPVSASDVRTAQGPVPGPMTVTGTMNLPTIPRATQPTVSPTSGQTGSTFTINHVPASSSFYHDVAYSLNGGSSYTNIQTNIVGTDTSTAWTPAHTLLPNSTSVTAIIRVITRATSGGTIIGTRTVNLPLTVPTSVRPTISNVTWGDAQTSSPDIPDLMGGTGRFIQRWSRLIPTVTSAGAGGSTVTGTTVTQSGQNTTSGTPFAQAVNLSGNVPFSAVATDSRGRTSVSYANTVSVTAYNYPNLPTPSVTRTSDAGGTTPAPTGTYLAVSPSASVSSLFFDSEQKNLMEWRIRTRPVGGSYTTVQDWTDDTVSGTTWTATQVFAGYAADTEYEVEVSIRDLFGSEGYRTAQTVVTRSVLVPSEDVFMVWDGDDGVGIGRYRQNGMLDVQGAIYQNAGKAVLDEDYSPPAATTTTQGVVELATNAETVTGTDTVRATTPAGVRAALNGEIAPVRIRIPTTTDASLSSTGHGFQIGPTSGTNLVADNNEIMARNNGSASTLNLNIDGGNITLGAASSTVNLPGRLNAAHLPYAMAAGRFTTVAGSYDNVPPIYFASGTTITLPAGRFTQAPIISAIIDGGSSVQWTSLAGAATTSSFIVRRMRVGANPDNGRLIDWIAVQMASGSAAG